MAIIILVNNQESKNLAPFFKNWNIYLPKHGYDFCFEKGVL
jgi:hypothetical protein